MTLPVIVQHAQQKGLNILSASDFTHPLWIKELKEQLEETNDGIYKLKSQIANVKATSQISKSEKDTLFLLSTEISSIYKQDGKLRRVHNLIFLPSLEAVERFNQELISRGCNLNADGRPIVGISSRNLLEILLHIDERAMLIPCHIWTPHFGVYGSASGFDSLEQAFGDLAQYVYGIETGISSDPGMNWEVAELRNLSILSFSDAHSAPKMGREATVFELEEASYEAIREAIMKPSYRSDKSNESNRSHGSGVNRISHTIEFYPEEGKYHFSGHRNCKVSIGPEEIRGGGNICPVCRRRLTEGVLFRVQQLVDKSLIDRVEVKIDERGVKWYADKLGEQPPFVKLVPLLEVVAQGIGSTFASQKSQALFAELCSRLGDEIQVLLESPLEEIARVAAQWASSGQGDRVAEAVQRVREAKIVIIPGYDGEYGKVSIWPEGEKRTKMVRTITSKGQLSLEL